MSNPQTMPEGEVPEWKKELRRIVDCGWQDSPHMHRFTFRVSAQTFARWKELAYG